MRLGRKITKVLSRPFSLASVLLAVIGLAVANAFASAQSEAPGWTEPIQLSGPAGDASEAHLVADQYGGLNAFWTEFSFESDRTLIYYSRFDGQSWTEPNDVYVSWPDIPIDSIAAAIDLDDTLHLIWTEGLAGPVFHSSAELSEAQSARAWSDARNIGLPAKTVELQIDDSGIMHVVYLSTADEFPGIFYTSSHVNGRLWSYPVQLDPDRPSTAIPDSVDLAVDGGAGLHAVWSYADPSSGSEFGRWVRYSRKLSGEGSWSTPQTIDMVDFSEEFLRSPRPSIAVIGETVHIIWGATHDRQPDVASINRFHSLSNDLGATWSDPVPVLGSLVGQAGGDGIAVDGAGRLHFASQLRWPQAIYQATWDQSWSEPQIVYLIREGSQDEFRDRIHAHFVRIDVIQGNLLVLIFRTPREAVQGILYAMSRPMTEVEHVEPRSIGPLLGTPVGATAAVTPVSESGPQTPHPTESTEVPLDTTELNTSPDPMPVEPMWVGVIPVVLLLAGVIAYRKILHRE